MSREQYSTPNPTIHQQLKNLIDLHPELSDPNDDIEGLIITLGDRYLDAYNIDVGEDETIKINGTLYNSETQTAAYRDSQKDVLEPYMTEVINAETEYRKMRKQEARATGPTQLEELMNYLRGPHPDQTPEQELQNSISELEDLSGGVLSSTASYEIIIPISGNCTIVNLVIEGDIVGNNDYFPDWGLESPSGKTLIRSLNDRIRAYLDRMDHSRAIEILTDDEMRALQDSISKWSDHYHQ